MVELTLILRAEKIVRPHQRNNLDPPVMNLPQVLIGSMDCLRMRPLWLARMITLVLILRHSIENRSSANKFEIKPLQTITSVGNLATKPCVNFSHFCTILTFIFLHFW